MKSIIAGGKTFRIDEIDGLVDCGSTDTIRQIILLNKHLTDDNKISTLLHEILEIANESNDLNLSHQTIQTLESFLFTVYKNNFT